LLSLPGPVDYLLCFAILYLFKPVSGTSAVIFLEKQKKKLLHLLAEQKGGIVD